MKVDWVRVIWISGLIVACLVVWGIVITEIRRLL
jgi:hypothetical protein